MICRVCGQRWVKWAGSALTCHARCVFTADEKELLLQRFEADPKLSEEKFARELGIPKSVVRASLVYAERARRGAA